MVSLYYKSGNYREIVCPSGNRYEFGRPGLFNVHEEDIDYLLGIRAKMCAACLPKGLFARA